MRFSSFQLSPFGATVSSHRSSGSVSRSDGASDKWSSTSFDATDASRLNAVEIVEVATTLGIASRNVYPAGNVTHLNRFTKDAELLSPRFAISEGQ